MGMGSPQAAAAGAAGQPMIAPYGASQPAFGRRASPGPAVPMTAFSMGMGMGMGGAPGVPAAGTPVSAGAGTGSAAGAGAAPSSFDVEMSPAYRKVLNALRCSALLCALPAVPLPSSDDVEATHRLTCLWTCAPFCAAVPREREASSQAGESGDCVCGRGCRDRRGSRARSLCRRLCHHCVVCAFVVRFNLNGNRNGACSRRPAAQRKRRRHRHATQSTSPRFIRRSAKLLQSGRSLWHRRRRRFRRR